jgi:hypothetical protein
VRSCTLPGELVGSCLALVTDIWVCMQQMLMVSVPDARCVVQPAMYLGRAIGDQLLACSQQYATCIACSKVRNKLWMLQHIITAAAVVTSAAAAAAACCCRAGDASLTSSVGYGLSANSSAASLAEHSDTVLIGGLRRYTAGGIAAAMHCSDLYTCMLAACLPSAVTCSCGMTLATSRCFVYHGNCKAAPQLPWFCQAVFNVLTCWCRFRCQPACR